MPARAINESALQAALVERLTKPDLGWRFVEGSHLPRALDDVMAEEEVLGTLARLNPLIGERPDRGQDVLTRLRAVLLSPANDGLVAANEEMVGWLCGRRTMRFVGTESYVPVRLIDFDDPRSNTL